MDTMTGTILDFLMSGTKGRLDDIRKLLGAEEDIRSNLRKADLAKELADYIRYEGEYWIRRFPERDVAIARNLVEMGPGKEYNAGPQPYQTLLETIGFLNCRIEKGNSIYSACPEMYDALKRGMPNAVAAMFAMQYPFFEQVARGVLNLFGCVPVDTMLEYMTDAAMSSDSDTTYRDINMFLGESLILDFHTIEDEKENIYYFDPGIPDPYHYLQGQLDFSNRTPEYKQFTLEEIMEAGDGGALCFPGGNTREGKALKTYLQKKGYSGKTLDVILNFAWVSCQEFEGNRFKEIIEAVGPSLRSMKDAQELLGLLSDYHNHMPKWIMKGFSPCEIREEYERKHPAPPQDPLTRFAMNSIPKVGRNDPCPCGSGKKYKDCHGKYQS